MEPSDSYDARSSVAHEGDLEWEGVDEPGEFVMRRKRLGHAAGAKDLGCSLIEIPVGKRSWPYHFHWGNEEAIYILAGQGRLRLAGQEVDVVPGDYVALARGPRGAHQLLNTGNAPLRYLCFSTMKHPDITVYPDSGKVGLFSDSAPGGSLEDRKESLFEHLGEGLDPRMGEPASDS